MKRIIKTFYNFINESEAVPTGAEVIAQVEKIWEFTASYGDPNSVSIYVNNPTINPKGEIRIDFNKRNTRILLDLSGDKTRPGTLGDVNKVVENLFLAAGAKQVPYKKKDGTYGYLNHVVDYGGMTLTKITEVLTKLKSMRA
jgi:hypothetical protein